MINWDNLIQGMKENKVVLLLGPNMFELEVEGEKHPLQSYLVKALQQYHERDLMAFYEQDGLFLFRKDSAKNESYFTLKTQLEKRAIVGDLLEKLTAIPIHLYLSFSPYLNPPKTFDKLGIRYFFHHGFYHKKRGAEETPEIDAERPLIYDMFGSIEEEESLILTHDDLFEYIRSILGAKELHTTLKAELQRARFFVFLGFPFEKWYVQLMLRLLSSINDQHKAYTWISEERGQDQEVLSFLDNEFGIEIIQDRAGVKAFVEQFYDQCEKAGLLRPDPSEGQGPFERIQQMLGKDMLEDAVEYMTDHLEDRDEDLFELAMGQSAILNRLARKASQGIMTQEEVDVKRNKIRLALTDINQQIKEL
jgi:DNA-directed RNA polymerase subunit L